MNVGKRVVPLTVGAVAVVVALVVIATVLPVPDGSRGAADTVYRMIASIAIIVGGSFAYFQFVAGRTLQKRLELTVSGSVEHAQGFVYLSVDAVARNIGNSRVAIEGERNLLEVAGHNLCAAEPVTEARQADWHKVSGWPVMAHTEALEPQEQATESLLLQIPEVSAEDPYKAFMLTLYVFAGGGQIWEAVEIVKIGSTGDN